MSCTVVWPLERLQAAAKNGRHRLSTLRSPREMGGLDLSRRAYVENEYAGKKVFDTTGSVHGFFEEHGTISFATDAPGERFAVVTTTYWDGWRATVDGEEVPVYRVNGSFMGVPIPAGAHRVRLEYRPTLIASLFAINVIVLLGLMGYCTVWGVRALRA